MFVRLHIHHEQTPNRDSLRRKCLFPQNFPKVPKSTVTWPCFWILLRLNMAEGMCGREQSSAHNIQQSEEGTGHQMRASVTHLPGVIVNVENSQFDGIWNRLRASLWLSEGISRKTNIEDAPQGGWHCPVGVPDVRGWREDGIACHLPSCLSRGCECTCYNHHPSLASDPASLALQQKFSRNLPGLQAFSCRLRLLRHPGSWT